MVYVALGRRRGADGRPPLILEGDNLAHLRELPDGVAQMVYADPPFNTGKHADAPQRWRPSPATTAATGPASAGAATRPSCSPSPPTRTTSTTTSGFLAPRLEEIWRVLHPTGTLYLHLDYREAHYVKLLLDELFGRECFLNELIWAYDYGAKSKGRWPQKHDTILVYVKDPRAYYFDSEAVDREPYMAPGLVTPEKVERGQAARCRVMWHTIVSPTGREKTGYPTQKPEGLLRRFVQASLARPATCAWTRSRAPARSAPWRASSAAATC